MDLPELGGVERAEPVVRRLVAQQDHDGSAHQGAAQPAQNLVVNLGGDLQIDGP